MDAILGVDLQAGMIGIGVDRLIHPCRAVAALRAGVFVPVHRLPARLVAQYEVRRLVLLVVGVADEHRGELVERELAVGLWILDLLSVGHLNKLFVVGVLVVHGPGGLAAEHVGVHGGVSDAAVEAEAGEGGADVARPVQLGMQPALAEPLLHARRLGRTIVLQRLGHGFGGDHAGLHGGMGALDLRHVEEPGRVAQQGPARKGELGDRLQAAFAERPRAIADAPPALEMLAHVRVGLEPLHLVERREPGVAVVQADHEAIADQVLAEMIQPRAAVGAAVERPAGRVLDQPGLVLPGGDLPKLLDADGVGLRVAGRAQVEPLHHGLGQAAPAAFGEQGISGAQLHAGLVVGAGFARLGDAHVAGGDADDASVLLQQLGGGEAWVDLNAQSFGLPAKPAAGIAEADDVVAFVVHLPGRGQTDAARGGQVKEAVLLGLGVERRAILPPVRQQLVQRPRLDHRAGEDVRPDLAALLHHADGGLRGELFEPDRGREAGRACPYDHHVELHRLAL